MSERSFIYVLFTFTITTMLCSRFSGQQIKIPFVCLFVCLIIIIIFSNTVTITICNLLQYRSNPYVISFKKMYTFMALPSVLYEILVKISKLYCLESHIWSTVWYHRKDCNFGENGKSSNPCKKQQLLLAELRFNMAE